MTIISQCKLAMAALTASALLFGCASAPEVVYVKEAQQVTTQALEPVMLESAELENDIKRLRKYFTPDMADDFINVVQTEIANTKRFTKVLLNISEGDTYIIQPRIEKVSESLLPIASDPTRRRFTARARTRLDVFFINQKTQKELVKSFYDDRKIEQRISKRVRLTPEMKLDYILRATHVSFRAAADQLGNAFNPSYEMGTISRISGRVTNIQINTSKIRKMPRKQQAVEVIDDDNRVLATVAELIVEDGNITGKLFEKSGASIKEGAKVRARVNGLTD
ncbi:MAG TPA: hypothetical protein PLN25_03655 [Deltaproteobacteria bacterium]|nr:hypothetical protein [Deltaproteobacteria bacterium]HQB38526.1 hypothetical protein [Deltaproteobacteria bacterium]